MENTNREDTPKVIDITIDKHIIPTLPRVLFEGRIITINTVADANKAVAYLLKQPILGLDTETRPSFKRNQSYKVSLLQVSTLKECFLFRLNLIGLPPSVVTLLSDKTQLKIGLSFQDDVRMLHQRAPFTMGKLVELQELVKQFGIQDISLQKIYANLFHQRISKTQRLSNWENDVLSDSQKEYAATDAWACIMIYNCLRQMKQQRNYIVNSPVSTDKLVDKVVVQMVQCSRAAVQRVQYDKVAVQPHKPL